MGGVLLGEAEGHVSRVCMHLYPPSLPPPQELRNLQALLAQREDELVVKVKGLGLLERQLEALQQQVRGGGQHLIECECQLEALQQQVRGGGSRP